MQVGRAGVCVERVKGGRGENEPLPPTTCQTILRRLLATSPPSTATTHAAAVNECDLSPCLNGGTCFDEDPFFKCACVDGWAGETCEIGTPIYC